MDNDQNDGWQHLRRMPRTQLISISQIDFSPLPEEYNDNNFTNLYSKYLTGKLSICWTRLSMDRLVQGFYRRVGSSIQLVTDPLEERGIKSSCRLILGGNRMPLMVYPDIYGQAPNKFICTDDQYFMEAYRRLNISPVPVCILASKPRNLEYSGIRSQYNKNGQERFIGVVKTTANDLATLIGADNNFEMKNAINRLKVSADSACRAIKRFHRPDRNGLDYHETLYSVAFRVKETLVAIGALIRIGKPYQAQALLRPLYELGLNFFLDWLAPEQVGPILQFNGELQTLRRDGRAASAEGDRKIMDLETIRSKLGTLPRMAENIQEKADLAPLGQALHSKLYAELSSISHQDFTITELYGGLLSRGGRPKFDPDNLRMFLRYLDLIVADILLRILSDVGAPPTISKGHGSKTL